MPNARLGEAFDELTDSIRNASALDERAKTDLARIARYILSGMEITRIRVLMRDSFKIQEFHLVSRDGTEIKVEVGEDTLLIAKMLEDEDDTLKS